MRITGELAGFAETSIADATRVLVNARRYLAAHPDTVTSGLTALVGRLSVTIERADRVVQQTRTRLAGDLPPSATRLISMHDPDARPIAKGRLGKPVEFGYKAQVTDNRPTSAVSPLVTVSGWAARYRRALASTRVASAMLVSAKPANSPVMRKTVAFASSLRSFRCAEIIRARCPAACRRSRTVVRLAAPNP